MKISNLDRANLRLDEAVMTFISTYLKDRPRSKFSNLMFVEQKALASKYCRFVFCCSNLERQGKLTLTEISVLNAKAEKALHNCNVNKVNKLANKMSALLA